MAKIPYDYYRIDPWKVIEDDYDPKRNRVTESIFSLANEYMGVRGILEEGVDTDTLIGSYFNGIYEMGTDDGAPNYKGVVRETHFMVNAVNWLYTRLSIDGERIDITKSTVKNFKRILDLKKGNLLRSFIVTTKSGKDVYVEFNRFLSMTTPYYGYQRFIFKSLSDTVGIELTVGLDYSIVHWGANNYWHMLRHNSDDVQAVAIGETKTTKQRVFSGYRIDVDGEHTCTRIDKEQFIGHRLKFTVTKEQAVTVDKKVTHLVDKDPNHYRSHLWEDGITTLNDQPTFDEAFGINVKYWEQFWEQNDIVIDGDDKNQQGIRFCIFQLQQTYNGVDSNNNIGAKGLTGEAYSGHAFWDTETYCLPFFLFNNPEAARNLLLFRYNTLDQARKRAKELDCRGAWYPIATLNGHEASTLWQHSSIQMQPSTAVAYGIWHYVKITDDKEFLYQYGAEMLVEISRLMVSRGQWNATKTKFGYYGVMGPDEFQMMVNHNAYTNFMAKKTLAYTLETLNEMKANVPDKYHELFARLDVKPEELDEFKICHDAMYIPYDEERQLFEQHEGFFDLPHIDIHSIPVEEFPLYNHWSYDRIFRNDMIKQPDVLMFMFLYNQQFTLDQKRANYEYYEPRTIHESSLSPSIHSVFAAELGKVDEAIKFFEFATRMDLDDYNRNTCEGLHMTSIAAAWINIVYGFGGLRSDGEQLVINPMLPDMWNGYTFHFKYQESHVTVSVSKEHVTLVSKNKPMDILVYGDQVTITNEPLVIPLKDVRNHVDD